jgi:alpha/beta hydrolase family protein
MILRLRRAGLPLGVLLAALYIGVSTAQAPLPVRGQGPAPGRQGQAPPTLPASPGVAPTAGISTPIGSPGEMFPALMSLPAGDDLAHFKYTSTEYFVTGTANGIPYKTRIVVRKPADNSRFSGIVLAESMHPSGNAWMFHFTHTYTMTSGHIGVEIVTSDPAQFVEFNGARYSDMRVQPGQANEIIAQVGAMLRSSQAANPLNGLRMRKMILAGTSASAGVLINYLPAHMVYRLSDMKPIYDGFLPTSNGTNIRQLDVPMIQVPTTTEASRGNVPTRQDGDMPGNQFRVYEFPGMPHLDTRDVEAFRPNPCKSPVTLWPMSTYMSVALHHLVEWIDKGTVPPRADRILVDRNTANDGSLIALDEHGNPQGGIRNPYVDVPVAKYGFPNEGAVPPTPNTVPWVSRRTVEGIDDLCHLTGYQIAITAPELKKLYGSKEQYVAKVRARVDELTRQGWSLPVYRSQILADAAKVNF